MVKAVVLDEPGERPRWGQDGGDSPGDDLIADAKDGPFAAQRKVFYGCAAQLFANSVLDSVDQRDDHSDDAQWLKNLATWFGWSDAQREEVLDAAARDVFDA